LIIYFQYGMCFKVFIEECSQNMPCSAQIIVMLLQIELSPYMHN
jgi:hypothetical protein